MIRKFKKKDYFLMLLLVVLGNMLTISAQNSYLQGDDEALLNEVKTYSLIGTISDYSFTYWDSSGIIQGGDIDVISVDVLWSTLSSDHYLSVEFYDNFGGEYIEEIYPIEVTLPVYLWYPDSDGDSFGDFYAEAVEHTSNTVPPYTGWVQNNDDYCPQDAHTTNNGCELGYVHENLNWITAKTYDINGTLKASSKAYFNDLGKGIQSQSVDIKTGRTWATQTMYDAQGRPALNTLSAPVRASGSFEYAQSFVQDNTNNTYTSLDFENYSENPTPIGTSEYTLGHYYSEANETDTNDPDPVRKKGDSYQDVTEYPFSRTIYSKLNPGTVLKTIGGNKVDRNNDGTADAWLQSYTFSMPAGDELTQAGAFNDPSYKADENRKIIKTISQDVHGNEIVVFTDTDGKTLAAARVGATTSRQTIIPISEQGFVDVHVPVGINTGFTINNVGNYTLQVFNLITEKIETTSTNNLPSGFYRISMTPLALSGYNSSIRNTPNFVPVTINCKENYYDYSLNEYDDVGRLISSKQPLNHLESTFEYNALGRLTQTHSPDEGDAWFLYRKDGQIRFSTNSKQWKNHQFSYTNYDNLGRPVESGVYTNTSNLLTTYVLPQDVTKLTDPFNQTLKDLVDTMDGLADNNCTEVQHTTYDFLTDNTGGPGNSSNNIPDELESLLGNTNVQDYNPTFLAGNVAKTHNDNTTTYYSYDVYGRVKWIVQNILGLGVKTIDYKYDPVTGAVTEVDFQKNVPSERFIHRYTYDAIDKSLIQVETSDNGNPFITHARYKYNETGALKRLELAPLNNTGVPLQGIDYVYNLDGQLKSINHPDFTKDPGGDSNDLFGMQIDYHNNDYARSDRTNITAETYGENQFNGNIKGVRWNNKNLENTERTFSYYYNKNNWLTDAIYGSYNDFGGDNVKINIFDDAEHVGINKDFEATNSITLSPGFHAKPDGDKVVTAKIISGSLSTFQSGDYNVFDITYDANGNIKTLNRNKNSSGGSNKMDYLNYTYKANNPNQLLRVDDAAGEVLTGKDIGDQGADNYKYNEIGQLIKNEEENIDYIYNTSGLVTEIKKDNQTLIKFLYNDKGHRVKKESYLTSPMQSTYYVRDASGVVLAIYEGSTLKEYPIYGAGRLGVYNKVDNSSVYQLTDHLGNVRAVAQWSGSTAVAMVATDYYPFGMPMPNRNNGENSYRYAFQGQEKDPETGKEAFELRLWDSRIGRWLTTDPYRQYNSPYLGMGNDPINGIDPDGGLFGRIRAWTHKLLNGGSIHQRTDGKWAWQKGTSLANENGDLTGVSFQYKNFGYGGFGKFSYETKAANIKANLDVGFQKVKDGGAVGTSFKFLTADLLTFKADLMNGTGEVDYLGKNGEVKGRALSLSRESGKLDLKGGFNYVAKDWIRGGIVYGKGTASTIGYIFPTNVTYSKIKAGVGRPYLESKVELTKEHFTIHLGFQEDWGNSYTEPRTQFGIGTKLDLIFQGIFKWEL